MSQGFSFANYSSSGASQPSQGGGGAGGAPMSGAGAGNGNGSAAASSDGSSSNGLPEYTLSGILHFLQSEWRRYEHDRNSWEIERAELRARIALLEGERRGIENVKTDLLRRIKMLEYALRQERTRAMANAAPGAQGGAKVPGEKQQSGDSSPRSDEGGLPAGAAVATSGFDLLRTAVNQNSHQSAATQTQVRLPPGTKDAKSRAKSREYLQQCLQEIAYLTNPTTLNPLPDRTPAARRELAQSSGGVQPRPRMALDEASTSTSAADGPGVAEPATSAPAAADGAQGRSEPAEQPIEDDAAPPAERKQDSFFVDSSARAPQDAAGKAGAGNSGGMMNGAGQSQMPDVQLWKARAVVRAHFDTVRGVVFDRNHPGLFSVSDDCTVKYWRVEALESGAPDGDVPIEHALTLRGHTAPVTSLVYSKRQNRLFTGGLDASVRIWAIPEGAAQKRADVAVHLEHDTLVDNMQAVWDLALLPYQGQDDALLATASADGKVRLWHTDERVTPRLLHAFDYFGVSSTESEERAAAANAPLPVPTSVAACPANPRLCAVSFSNSTVKLFNVNDGREMKRLASDRTYDGTPGTQMNMVVARPTLPLLATAHEDSYVRMFDIYTGEQIMSVLAHGDAVTSIDIDPAGLTLVSASQDCTVRFWDIVEQSSNDSASRDTGGAGEPAGGKASAPSYSANCFQEVRAHQPKGREGVLSVAYHPTAPFVATGGADGTVRLFG